MIRSDSSPGRILRSEVLGPVSKLSRGEALTLLETRLRPINTGQHQPYSVTTFAEFALRQFEPGILPTLKFATQESCAGLLRRHLIPRFGKERLCDIRRFDVQQFLIEKLKQGLSWETTNHLRHLLSKVLRTAVEWDYLPDNVVRGVRMPERFVTKPRSFLSVSDVTQLLEVI